MKVEERNAFRVFAEENGQRPDITIFNLPDQQGNYYLDVRITSPIPPNTGRLSQSQARQRFRAGNQSFRLIIISGFYLLLSRLLARCTLILQLSLLTVSTMSRGCGRYLVLSYGSSGCLRLCVPCCAVWRWGLSVEALRCMDAGFRRRVTPAAIRGFASVCVA